MYGMAQSNETPCIMTFVRRDASTSLHALAGPASMTSTCVEPSIRLTFRPTVLTKSDLRLSVGRMIMCMSGRSPMCHRPYSLSFVFYSHSV